jgi:predicted secreted protein
MGRIMLPQVTWLLLICLLLSPSTLLATEATITVTKAQSGREIALKPGSVLRVELPGNAGTGYNWSVEASGAPYLKLMSQATQPVGKPQPGSPVMQVWHFKAEKPGATEIKMAYYRPWEGVAKAGDHFFIKIRIE